MKSHANRLTPRTRTLIRRMIAAGKSNAQIRQSLTRNGHTGDISRSLLSFYRKSVEKQRALFDKKAAESEIAVRQLRFVDVAGHTQGILSIENGVLTLTPVRQ